MNAKFKHIRISPQKVRGVVNLVRGKNVNEAIGILRFTRRSAALPILKMVRSAMANAKQKGGVDVDNLYIKKIAVDKATIQRRFRARSRGMAHSILKRSSHLSVELGEK